MTNKIDFLKGKSGWSHILQPSKFGKWTIELCLENESLSKVLAWKKEGIMNHITKDDDGYWVTISRPMKIKRKDGSDMPLLPPPVWNADDTPYMGTQIGKGSDVEVKVELRDFTVPATGVKGKSMRLVGVRIHNLEEFHMEQFPDYKPFDERK